MLETVDRKVSRRSYLKYVEAGIAAVTEAGIGYYYFLKYKCQPITLPTPTTTTNFTSTTATSPALSPLASYAKSKGLSNSVLEKLESKLASKPVVDRSYRDYMRGMVNFGLVKMEGKGRWKIYEIIVLFSSSYHFFFNGVAIISFTSSFFDEGF
jgi:hypothetical protein